MWLKRHLSWSLCPCLVVRYKDDDPAICCRLVTDEFLDRLILGHTWLVEVAKYHHAHHESRQYVVFMQIAAHTAVKKLLTHSAHTAGAIILLRNLADVGYQSCIFCLAPHVTDGKQQPLLNVDCGLPVLINLLRGGHSVLSVL